MLSIINRKLRDRIAQLDSENTALTKAHLETWAIQMSYMLLLYM